MGDEPYEPYDRPPLSKQVLAGRLPVEHTMLARFQKLDAEWKLGVAATGLDLPPYRNNAALRGPRHLLVNFESLKD